MPLTLVPTPIGNLEDITLRALRVLRNADLIACEDTRTSSVLLRRYHIAAPLVPFHLHNEKECLPRLMGALRAGKSVAVVSDAGTPGVSDPGWILLRSALDEGIEADVLPGPSALLPAENFLFPEIHQKWYPKKDYHIVYIGEILEIVEGGEE